MDIQLSLIIECKIYRECITNALNMNGDMSVTHSFSSANQAIRSVDHCESDIILIDGNARDLTHLIDAIHETHPSIKTILLVNALNSSIFEQYVSLGTEGVVTHSDGLPDLIACILSVHSGHLCYPKEMSRLLKGQLFKPNSQVSREGLERPLLTRRQTIVMELIATGLSNKEIARQLNIELSTVKNHVHQILERLKVKSRLEACARFRVQPNRSSLLT
jgi:DNA-binding NarL/FixJ family response regulator